MSAVPATSRFGRYTARINYLLRYDLDEQGPRVPDEEVKAAVRTAVDLKTRLPIWSAQVKGMPRLPEESSYWTSDILVNLYCQHVPLYFAVRGRPRDVQFTIATLDVGEGTGAAVRAIFESHCPGIQLIPERAPSGGTAQGEDRELAAQQQMARADLEALRAFLHGCHNIGVVTGMVEPSLAHVEEVGTQLDRLISALYGSEWALLVLAEPEDEARLLQMMFSGQREKVHEMEELGVREQRELVSQDAAYYYSFVLEEHQKFVENCLGVGGWWVQSYLAAPDEATYARAKALLRSVFAGRANHQERIRILDCPGAGPKAASFSPILVERPRSPAVEVAAGGKQFKYHTLLSSLNLSTLIHFPRFEMPGYFVRDLVAFDVSSHVPPEARSIELGEILARGRHTGNPYRVPVDELNKHALTVGITGSGKTNTVFHLLQQLQKVDPPVPFLVIEPAKREYRALAHLLPPGRELRVFTVGEEGEGKAPFRFNPFEIRLGVPVQAHIDLLKSVFNASFGMWTPLPQVLERAIHEVYRDKGWDAVHSVNTRDAPDAHDGAGWHPGAHPTLTDLFLKISDLVPRLGYDKEITRNVQTALQTRVNSLRMGAKGMTLDTAVSIPIERLLEQPTVLELEGIGDDDEKAFLMGLILTALYEYYRTQPGLAGGGLRHITVIEEAHRLLANAPASSDPEASNLRGKAVETFVNMLSEVRAYGEGFVIAEQIPTKLAPDVVKNTALKVMHRVVSNDDRLVMGGAMNLVDPQVRHVVGLGTGEAVVHGGGRYGDDNAILIRVPAAKGDGRAAPTGADVQRAWERFRDSGGLAPIFLPRPTCGRHCAPVNPRCGDARTIAEGRAVAEAFRSFVLALVVAGLARDEGQMAQGMPLLFRPVGDALRSSLSGSGDDTLQTRCAATHGLYGYMEWCGAQYGWMYDDVTRLTGLLLPAVLAAAAQRAMTAEERRDLMSFCNGYARLCSLAFEPFYGCGRSCGRPPTCFFRYAMEALVQREDLTSAFETAGADWDALAAACELAAERAVALPGEALMARADTDVGALRAAAYCFAVQKTYSDPVHWFTQNREFALDQLLQRFGW